MKKSQLLMVWLLPVIVIGGLFNPFLGYLMVGMMAVLLVMAVFRGRYWCWNLCPMGLAQEKLGKLRKSVKNT